MDKGILIQGYLVYARTTDRVSVSLTFPPSWQMADPVRCTIGKATSSVIISAISPPEGRTPRILTLDNGNKIFIAAKDFPPQLNQHKWAGRIDRAERSFLPYLIGITVLVMLCFAGLAYWGLPKLSDKLATYIPEPVIAEISDGTLSQLDSIAFQESRLMDSRQEALQKRFALLRAQSGLPADITLLFRSSSLMGPNALALPGGPVILLDELVEIAPSDDGISGVLAHELAHIALQHNRKQLARNGLFSLIAILTGTAQDFATSTGLLKNLVFSSYSREFEEEADRLARLWMAEAGYDSTAFDEMLIALYEHHCGDECPESLHEEASGFFHSHPSLSERLTLQGQ